MGEQTCVALRITERLAKLCVLVGDEVLGILVGVGGGEGGARAFSFPFLVGGGACLGLGLRLGGRRLGEGGCRGCHMM